MPDGETWQAQGGLCPGQCCAAGLAAHAAQVEVVMNDGLMALREEPDANGELPLSMLATGIKSGPARGSEAQAHCGAVASSCQH